MTNKSQSLTLASPFKFGFYAGLGFFVASLLTSGITIMFVAVLGIGTIGAVLGGHVISTSSNTAPSMQNDTQPAPTHLERWQR